MPLARSLSGRCTSAVAGKPILWEIGEVRLVADGSGFDMASSLPAGVNKGGTFSVSPSGAPLPTGVTLSPEGILTAGVEAQAQSMVGVVFVYEEAST